jgi:hypothetical protein
MFHELFPRTEQYAQVVENLKIQKLLQNSQQLSWAKGIGTARNKAQVLNFLMSAQQKSMVMEDGSETPVRGLVQVTTPDFAFIGPFG